MNKQQRIIKVCPNNSTRVSCPTKDHENWNLHPRVYIDLKDRKTNTCPYCGTVFKLKN